MDTTSKLPFDIRDNMEAQRDEAGHDQCDLEKEKFCLPCWASIALLVIVIIWLFVPIVWYAIKYGIQ